MLLNIISAYKHAVHFERYKSFSEKPTIYISKCCWSNRFSHFSANGLLVHVCLVGQELKYNVVFSLCSIQHVHNLLAHMVYL